jgi:regulator of sigma E protease
VSWFLAFAGFAMLIILHELGHFVAAKAVGMRVERFSLFFGRTPLRFQRGETEYGIGWIPLGGFVKITGMNPQEEIPAEAQPRAYYRQPVWKRLVVIGAGPAVNIALAFLILTALFWFSVGDPRETKPTNRIEQVTLKSPAAAVLRAGDRITAVDGRTGTPTALRKQIATHECAGGVKRNGCKAAEPVKIEIERGGQQETIEAFPVYSAASKRPLLGFGFDTTEPPSVGPATAAELSVLQMWYVTKGSVSVIAQIFKPEKRKELSGVVGTYEVTRQNIELGFQRGITLLAIISLSLGVINLFPFLPLDGGHIFWALAEKVRGRPIPFSIMERSGFIGFALVMVLFIIGFTNDVGRLTGEGFGVR